MQVTIPVLEIEAFILVVFRVGGIFFFAPVFGGRNIPMPIRAALALWLAFSFYPMVDPTSIPHPDDGIGLTFAIFTEFTIGVLIGIIGQVISAAVQFGGSILGKHMGFRIANVFDPSFAGSVSLLGAFMNIATLLLLLTFDFHLVLLQVIAKSYELIPPLTAQLRLGVIEILLRMGANIYMFAIQIVFPVLAAIFFVEIIIGVMAKTARQFNMLMLQFPIKIAVGLIFFVALLKGFPDAISMMLEEVLDQIRMLLKIMSP